MAVPKIIHEAKGFWRGRSSLHEPHPGPDLRVSESDSQLHIDTDGQDTFATITYTWRQDGKRQEGTMLICKANHTPAVQIAWVDSWHENSAVMHLVGEESESGSVKAKGTYGTGKEVWGWTIEFALSDAGLTLLMDNVTPDGAADWAAKATYGRA